MLVKKLNFFLLIIFILLCSCGDEEDVIPEDPGPLTPYDKSSTAELKAKPPKLRMPLHSRKKWQVVYVDSHMASAKCGPEKAFDDNPGTHWHTEWKPKRPKPPHEIQIDMGEELNVCGFMQMPRQDKMPNGIITQYEFYVSNDPKNWGSPATKGSFKNNKKNRSMQLIYFKGSDQSKTNYKGRYIRLVAKKGFKNMPFTSIAELNVIIEE